MIRIPLLLTALGMTSVVAAQGHVPAPVEETVNFAFAVMEPVGAPDAVEPPAQMLQNTLS